MYCNPVRWVCQRTPNGKKPCNGMFYARGYFDRGEFPCPLYHICRGGDPQLETLYPTYRAYDGKVLFPEPDPIRRKAHIVEGHKIERCFFGDYDRRYYSKNKEVINRKACEKAHEKVLVKQAALVANTPITSVPPCGADCENCPYDDGCRYADWNDPDEETPQHRKERLWNAAYMRERRAKLRSDPVAYAAHLEAERQRDAKRRYRKKWVANGGDLEDFEKAWASVGNRKEFKNTWSKCDGIPRRITETLEKERRTR